MDARHLLEGMTARGFAVSLEGEQLAVSPKSGLTPKLRDALKAHKRELVSLLSHGNPFAQGAGTPSVADAKPQPRGLPLGADAPPDAPTNADENRSRLNRLEGVLGTEGAARAIWRAAYDLERTQAGFWALLGRESRHTLAICAACLDNKIDPLECL